jgi:hypothetical protein
METFQKRQKEMRRLERQRDKAARRIQRKQNRDTPADDTPPEDAATATPEDSPAPVPTTDV